MTTRPFKRPACKLQIGDRFSYVGSFTEYIVAQSPIDDLTYPGRVVLEVFTKRRLIKVRLDGKAPCWVTGCMNKEVIKACRYNLNTWKDWDEEGIAREIASWKELPR